MNEQRRITKANMDDYNSGVQHPTHPDDNYEENIDWWNCVVLLATLWTAVERNELGGEG